jgi:hypothetical protein
MKSPSSEGAFLFLLAKRKNSKGKNTMTEENTTQPSEIDTLKQRADLMGIKYHPNIGVEKLRNKINRQLELAQGMEDEDDGVTDDPTAEQAAKMQATEGEIYDEAEFRKRQRANKRREAGKLVRIRVTCMNPNKKEWEGEIISVGSAQLGTYKKYVPFNLETGYHVPNIIYKAMKARKCTVFHTVKGPRGDKIRKGRLVNEFAIEVLPALTEAELKELARKQAMAGSIDEQ